MLQKATDMYGYKIDATDGRIGKINDFLFDNTGWNVHYLVVETGLWLLVRKVLIPSIALCPPNTQMSIFPANLTKDQASDSPDIDTDKPVSLQHRVELDAYYWSIPLPMDFYGMPDMVETPNDGQSGKSEHYEPHLQSTCHVAGYHIEATDCRLGNIANFIVDDENWNIPYLIVDTINWLPSKWALVPTSRVTKINWKQKKVEVGLSSEIIKKGPLYYPIVPIDHRYEYHLREYYSR